MRRYYGHQEWTLEHQALLAKLDAALARDDEGSAATLVKAIIFLADHRPEHRRPTEAASTTLVRIDATPSGALDVQVDMTGLARLTPAAQATLSSTLSQLQARLGFHLDSG